MYQGGAVPSIHCKGTKQFRKIHIISRLFSFWKCTSVCVRVYVLQKFDGAGESRGEMLINLIIIYNIYIIYNYWYSTCTFEITKIYTRTHTLVHFETAMGFFCKIAVEKECEKVQFLV